MEATPLVYRPGRSTSCVLLDIADSRPRRASGVWRCIDLGNLAVAAGDHHARANGSSHASTSGTHSSSNNITKTSRPNGLKRSASPEDALLDLGHSASNAKKPRTEKSTSFKRVLTHTFLLQPYRASDVRMKGMDKHQLYPESLAVDLSAFPAIKSGGLQVASLSDSQFTRLYPYYSRSSSRSFGVDDLVSCLAVLHHQTDLLKLKAGPLRKVVGQFPDTAIGLQARKEIALDFYYTLEVEIHLDIANLGNVDTSDMKKSFVNLLPVSIEGVLWNGLLVDRNHEEILRPIEERSGKTYTETNLEWVYSCLSRPPLSGSYNEQDLKGKGKAKKEDLEIDEFTGSRPIEAPGLVPTLHPFQCRSLEWMLYREGKVLAGRDHDGKQTVRNIQNPARQRDLRRSSMWPKAVFDDGEEWWFCPTSSEFTKEDPGNAESKTIEGSILAEEMGLGKTVELLSLILLSQEPERNQLRAYDAEWLATDVQPSNLTLLVCPLAIIGQWADEITRHAPGLRVLRYAGMKTTYPKDDGKEVERTIKRFDVVLCDFDTMASDLDIARKPRLHHTRAQVARGNRVTYRRSVLVGIEWLRVILDEAQMAASTTSAISETASFIPRRYSWAVSGTPIKQTIKDLSGLLHFLRVYDVGSNNLSFQKLLKPELADVFSNLVSRIGIRTVKAQIEGELSLPSQERFIVPVNFTPIELYNYRARYGDALTELNFHMDASRLTSTWSIDRFLMSRWLHTLRQACFYAQAAAPNRDRGNNGRKAEEVAIQTLDDILLDLRGKNISELHSDQRSAAVAKVDRGYRVMYDKEDCERYERGLKILNIAKRDLHLLAQDIFNELLEIFPEARASDSDSRASSTTPVPELAGYPYLTMFQDKVRELMDKRTVQDSTTKAKNKTKLIATFSLRLRDVLFIMHKTIFFIGNAYFNMGNKEEEETAAYAEADALRKQILHTDEVEAMKEVRRLDTRLREKRITEDETMLATSTIKGGLQSRGAFEDIDLLSQKANQIAELMLKWRKFVIDALSADLTDSEVTETEYQAKAEAQEKLDIYIEYLARIQADWIQLVTGTKSTLIENIATGLAAKPVQKAINPEQPAPLSVAEMQDDIGTSKRSKRKQQMNINNRKANIAAADPATKLRGELEAERKNVVPAFMRKKKKQHRTATRGHDEEESDADEEDFPADTSLRERLRGLQRLKENALREEEELIVAAEASRLRKELYEKDRIIEKLRMEQNIFADVYNARVKFYRVMQEFGDSVAVLPDDETTPGALRAEIERLRQREVELDHQMLAKIARRRYLDSLKDANLAEDGCLICANTEIGQMVLTHCGHCMHEKCLRTWCTRSGSRTCPVCRASLNREKAWRKIQMEEEEAKIGAKTSKDTNGHTLAGDGAASSSQLPESGTADMQIDDAEGVNNDDPSRQLKFLAPEEVEHILDMPLAGASLGSKLDTIVKHVKLLRERHQTAIEKYDEDLAQGRAGGRRDTTSHPGVSALDTADPPSEAKVLIYSAWQYACDVLAAAFRREGIRFVRLEGGGSGKKENATLEFKENPDCAVFILHAKSQAAGLTLTAASYVFLVEPLLEPALETQAIARVHRIGQKRKTTVFQYIIPDTVDERIALLSLRKWKHTIFSCSNSTGSVQESTIAATLRNDEQETRKKTSKLASKRSQDAKTFKKDSLVDGDALSADDLARLVLDKDGMASLKVIQDQVALLAREKEETLARAREESDLLNMQILQANGNDEGLADDWDEWDLGQHGHEWLLT